jgi:predicted metal-dependent phosphoesterase TrpH
MIDLHTHSTASDGTLTPEELVDLAAEKGLRAIALTDHDTVGGISAALERGNQRRVLVIPGVELGACWNGDGEMHILGYHVDHQHPFLLDRLSWLRARRRERAEKIVSRLHEIGVPVSGDRVLQLAGSGSVGRPHVARALLEAGYVQSVSEAFDRYLKAGAPAFLEKFQFTSAEAIELITISGGVAVLAHPATLRLSPDGLGACLEQLINEGLRGIEVYWSKHDKSEISYYEQLATRYALIITGGSDFHGSNKPTLELGAKLNGHVDEAYMLRALQRGNTPAGIRTAEAN